MPLDETMKPVTITDSNLRTEITEATEPVVVDFWAPWCGPCRMVGPVLDRLAESYAGRVKVAKVNVDEEQKLAATFRISGIPTLAIMHKGKLVDKIVGFPGAKAIEELFAALSQPELLESAS